MNAQKLDLGGILAIPITPFNNDGSLDKGALKEVVEAFIKNGADVIVGPVFVSEFYALTDLEREVFVGVCVDAIDGRVPMLAGVSAPSTQQSLYATDAAKGMGANAVLAMPPYVLSSGGGALTAHYQEILQRADGMPLMIQNAPQPAGLQLSSVELRELISELNGEIWVKEETHSASKIIGDLVDDSPGNLVGLVGGMAGRYFLEEVTRGSRGTMPSGEFIDLHAKLWATMCEEGPDSEKAITQFSALLPLLIMENQYGIPFCKQLLELRGLPISPRFREPGGEELDRRTISLALKFLDRALEVFGGTRGLV